MYYLENGVLQGESYICLWQDLNECELIQIGILLENDKRRPLLPNGTKILKEQYASFIEKAFKSENIEDMYARAAMEAL